MSENVVDATVAVHCELANAAHVFTHEDHGRRETFIVSAARESAIIPGQVIPPSVWKLLPNGVDVSVLGAKGAAAAEILRLLPDALKWRELQAETDDLNKALPSSAAWRAMVEEHDEERRLLAELETAAGAFAALWDSSLSAAPEQPVPLADIAEARTRLAQRVSALRAFRARQKGGAA